MDQQQSESGSAECEDSKANDTAAKKKALCKTVSGTRLNPIVVSLCDMIQFGVFFI